MRTRWAGALLGAAAGALVAARYREALARAWKNVHTYSAPSAAVYDAVVSPVLDDFFTGVASDVTDGRDAPLVLEIGAGPGRLASRIAELSRRARVVAIDISPDMLERAASWADRSGVSSRVRFVRADARALPCRDATVDAVVSTFSVHHWSDQPSGLAEVRRVLRPGGVAIVYDIADWIARVEPGAEAAPGDGAFAGGWTRETTTRAGPLPLAYRAELRV